MKNLEFAMLDFWSYFGLVLPHCVPFYFFSLGMYILYHCIVEVCDLLFHFDFSRAIVKELL